MRRKVTSPKFAIVRRRAANLFIQWREMKAGVDVVRVPEYTATTQIK